jgi:hypothetical protein
MEHIAGNMNKGALQLPFLSQNYYFEFEIRFASS